MASATSTASVAPTAPGTNPSAELIARGAYLAKVGDCAACHTAPRHPSFAGGFAVNSPFGKIYSSNITPDRAYGIGSYSFEDFSRAVRDGVAKGGKRLYPAMPYASYTRIDDDELRALYAYFMHGVAPVHTRPPLTKLPFPFNQRWGLWFWDLAFVQHGRYEPRSNHDAQWNRGAYIVQGLGHCGACHTPRGPGYEERGYDERSRLYLTGSVNDNWFAANLTGDPAAGLGNWSAAELAAFLKQGAAGHGIAFGSMTQTVEDSLQYLTDADAQAVARYLKSLPAAASSGSFEPHSPRARNTQQWLQTGLVELPGAGIYMNFCARCHAADGKGNHGKGAPLAGNPAVLGSNPDSVIRIILEGSSTPVIDGDRHPPRKMPAFAGRLDDQEIAYVATLVRNTWGNRAEPVDVRQVRSLKARVAKSKQ